MKADYGDAVGPLVGNEHLPPPGVVGNPVRPAPYAYCVDHMVTRVRYHRNRVVSGVAHEHLACAWVIGYAPRLTPDPYRSGHVIARVRQHGDRV